jgi:hypothetical protein
VIALRALSMRMMSHWPMRGLLEKQFGKAEAITLKDYGRVTGRTTVDGHTG